HSIWNRKWVRIGAAAAAILLILTFGLHTWMLDLETNEPNQARLAENFRPGGNRAVLMMEDGRSILLRSDQEGLVVGERLAYLDGTELDKLEDGALKSNGILNTI